MKEVRSVVIVGGGTASWLTSAYLSYQFPFMDITVIDKEVGNPIGVGEATLLNFENYLLNCGFTKEDWFDEIDATIKTGILFPDWVEKGKSIWHPFSFDGNFDDWSRRQYMDYKSIIGTPSTQDKVAYQIDCGKLVLFLQDKIKDRIKLIKSDVVDVFYTKENNIDLLRLKNRSDIKGDLYIDCTGFKNLLDKNKSKIYLENRLICNSAIPSHIPYINKEKDFQPYTTCTAVENGWIWKIPTQTRIGSGIVFNRNITTPEEAENTFRKFWNSRIPDNELHMIDWTPYYKRNPWSGNIISIGLSAGFIEPLESTGVALIMEGVYQLATRLTNNYYRDIDIEIYNNKMTLSFEDCIDFVNMHYAYTRRTEPFWEEVKKVIKKSKTLNFYIEKLKSNHSLEDLKKHALQDDKIFSGDNWMCWLIQMGYKVNERKSYKSLF